ncbi:MAG: hypothetical protein EA367_10235 [Leptolyngbya sp. DLM2.Bin15]|nr:MAG: hypothetical protein EA367_10235 [Leptolyngbya sp. DLM2.Bin15]
MTALNRSTRRRLQKLPQSSSVWEGDRCALGNQISALGREESAGNDECILWVDATDAAVRSMDLVSSDAGPEVMVRGLLRSMESPHSPARPGRPKKIMVRNREIQFYLRGVLQDLDIAVDYVPELPLIDEIFRGLYDFVSNQPPHLPEAYAQPLMEVAEGLWHDAPWQQLDEEKILEIAISGDESTTLYASILGLEELEYGLLLYRSLDSLKAFREQVMTIADESPQLLEEAFLSQDCLFLTYDVPEEDDLVVVLGAAGEQELGAVEPNFGNLHPLEGMRPVLYEEEAVMMLLALSALRRFFRNHLASLSLDQFPKKTGRYQIPDPKDASQKVMVRVSTLPDVADELAAMSQAFALPGGMDDSPVLRSDVMPSDAFYSLGAMPWDVVHALRKLTGTYQAAEQVIPEEADGLPIVLIQTSRPKAIAMIEALQAGGGLRGIGFSPGEDPFAGERYDLGILQTDNGETHLFGEFLDNDPVHIQARKKWDQRCKKSNGMCGLVIARGLQGASRGNPSLKDMMALFEVRSLAIQDLGLGVLQLIPQFDL